MQTLNEKPKDVQFWSIVKKSYIRYTRNILYILFKLAFLCVLLPTADCIYKTQKFLVYVYIYISASSAERLLLLISFSNQLWLALEAVAIDLLGSIYNNFCNCLVNFQLHFSDKTC